MRSESSVGVLGPHFLGTFRPRLPDSLPSPRTIGVSRSDGALARRASVNVPWIPPGSARACQAPCASSQAQWADGGKGARGNLRLARAFRAEPQGSGWRPRRIYQARRQALSGCAARFASDESRFASRSQPSGPSKPAAAGHGGTGPTPRAPRQVAAGDLCSRRRCQRQVGGKGNVARCAQRPPSQGP